MFQINPYPGQYDHLLREIQALHVEQTRLDMLRAIFERRSPGRKQQKSVACTWLRCDRPQPVKTRSARHYLREWALDPNAPPKKRQRSTQHNGDPELKPSHDSHVFSATAGQIADISRLLQSGATLKEIGAHVGMTYQAVSRIMQALGLTRPEKPRKRALKATAGQIADVIRQRNDGVSYSVIATATGLTYAQVAKIARQNVQQAVQ